MTLDDALDWFGLDRATVNKSRLKDAYRRIAKELHPDTKNTFIDKMTAHDNFVAASKARDVIEDALTEETINRTTENSSDEYFEYNYEDDDEDIYKEAYEEPERYEDRLTGREKYDFHNRRPLERILGVPYPLTLQLRR